MKKTLASLMAATTIILSPAVAFAHVVVSPAEVPVASSQTFNTGVANEKDMAVTGLRLVMPAGLNEVSPTVKPGWNVDIKKDGDTVTELNWTGGSIPAGQRDDFTFGAQAPAKTTTLAWKAYQTYEDGTIVAWDQTPNGKDEESATPYSETKVINDLVAPAAETYNDSSENDSNGTTSTIALAAGVIGIVLGASALVTKRK